MENPSYALGKFDAKYLAKNTYFNFDQFRAGLTEVYGYKCSKDGFPAFFSGFLQGINYSPEQCNIIKDKNKLSNILCNYKDSYFIGVAVAYHMRMDSKDVNLSYYFKAIVDVISNEIKQNMPIKERSPRTITKVHPSKSQASRLNNQSEGIDKELHSYSFGLIYAPHILQNKNYNHKDFSVGLNGVKVSTLQEINDLLNESSISIHLSHHDLLGYLPFCDSFIAGLLLGKYFRYDSGYNINATEFLRAINDVRFRKVPQISMDEAYSIVKAYIDSLYKKSNIHTQPHKEPMKPLKSPLKLTAKLPNPTEKPLDHVKNPSKSMNQTTNKKSSNASNNDWFSTFTKIIFTLGIPALIIFGIVFYVEYGDSNSQGNSYYNSSGYNSSGYSSGQIGSGLNYRSVIVEIGYGKCTRDCGCEKYAHYPGQTECVNCKANGCTSNKFGHSHK